MGGVGSGRGGMRDGRREGRTIRDGRAHPAEHRCYFQELFFDTELERDSALPAASAEREVSIAEGFILARPGDLAGGNPLSCCPGVMLPTPAGWEQGGRAMAGVGGPDLSLGAWEGLRRIAAGLPLVGRN